MFLVATGLGAMFLLMFFISLFKVRSKGDVVFSVITGVMGAFLTVVSVFSYLSYNNLDNIVDKDPFGTKLYVSTDAQMKSWAKEWYNLDLIEYNGNGHFSAKGTKGLPTRECILSTQGSNDEIEGTPYQIIHTRVYCDGAKIEPKK